VRETLQWAVELSLPSSASRKDINDRVESLIKDFGLNRCASTPIGNPIIRGVSGGLYCFSHEHVMIVDN
jgi:ABC-type multidrug transport system ATPase subunit